MCCCVVTDQRQFLTYGPPAGPPDCPHTTALPLVLYYPPVPAPLVKTVSGALSSGIHIHVYSSIDDPFTPKSILSLRDCSFKPYTIDSCAVDRMDFGFGILV